MCKNRRTASGKRLFSLFALGFISACSGIGNPGGNSHVLGVPRAESTTLVAVNSSEKRSNASGSGIATVVGDVACLPTGTTTSSVTCTFNTSPARGDLVLVGTAVSQNQHTGGPRTVTPPAGFTAITPATVNYDTMAAFYKIAGASEPVSYTFTTKIGDYFNAIAYDVQNPAPTPILGAPGIFGNGGNVETYSNITGAPAGSLGITLVSPDSGSVTSVPSAWVVGTDVLSRYHPMYAWLYNTFPSTSTGWSGTTTTTAAGRMIVIAPAPMPTSGANHINTVAYIGTGNTYSGSVSAIAPYLTAAYVFRVVARVRRHMLME